MSDTKVIKISDLKQGDILLFSAVLDDWESRLIAYLTKSPVSHSAMSYYDNSEIVEETPPCAQINSTKDRIVDRVITVMRLDASDLDMTKILDIAKSYVMDKEPYPMINLVFIGMYLLLKKTMINCKLQRLLVALMKHVIGDLVRFIDEIIYPGLHPMVCSQFVYCCYEEAGEEFKIICKDDSTMKSLVEYVQEYINDNKLNMESKLVNDINRIKVDNTYQAIDTEKLLEEIYNELENEPDNTLCNQENFLEEEFVITTHEFCSTLSNLFHYNKEANLLQNNENMLVSKSIKAMIDNEEYFISPGDLLTNCTNLINLGTLDHNSDN